MSQLLRPVSWERMVGAVEKVRQRLTRAVVALNEHAIPYAVIGGNAVAAWVSRVDETAVRNTQDVDILIRRADLPGTITALTSAGFHYQSAAGVDMFMDSETAGPRDAIHVVYASEFVRPEYLHRSPDVSETDESGPFNVLALEALVKMKLTSYRRKDQVHLLDLISVGLINADWINKLPTDLAPRLQELLDDPEG